MRSGNFETALRNLIRGLVEAKDEGDATAATLLARWDTDRGDDWYTRTRVQDEGKRRK